MSAVITQVGYWIISEHQNILALVIVHKVLDFIHQLGINPARVFIELTDNPPTYDYDLMREAVLHYR